jgi:uncharacterized damage-inducible protein DinB
MASLVEPILHELREEAPATRRVLEKIPSDKLLWKPHSKSRPLGELAMHVANIPGLAERIVKFDEFTLSNVPPPAPTSAEEIRATFEKNIRIAEELLKTMTDDAAQGSFRFIFKGKELFKKPRAAVLRTNLLNHMYHHRGQLSVYLRLLDISVPVVYGPTADENPFA